MEFERDEMFRLMSVRVSQWKATTRRAVINPGAAAASTKPTAGKQNPN